jgi:hypothetical protein
MKDDKPKDNWSECGQVFFHYGVGYGITKDLKNIYLGSEEDINHYFETGELNNQLNTKQKALLEEILEYRKEQGIGTDVGRPSVERTGDHGASRHKSKAIRSVTSRKRPPLRSPRAKSKSLSRR